MLVEYLLAGPDWSWLVTVLIALFTIISVKHLLVIRSLPPGPFPLPIVGNLLSFVGTSKSTHQLVDIWRNKYGNLFTFWLGREPTIMICDWDLCRDNLVVKRNEFSGKFRRRSIELFLQGSEDVIFGDFNPCWETLRKIMASAIRKYSISETLPGIIANVVDEVTDLMIKDGNPLLMNDYIYLAIYNVLASSAFGRKFGMNDADFIGLRTNNDLMNESFADGLPSDALPILSFLYKKRENGIRDSSIAFRTFFEKEYKKHNKTYQKGTVRDFMDAVIAARDEAEEESKDSLDHLSDTNIISLNVDLFTAGTDTTRISLNWIMLYISNYPQVQKRMQDEIDESIGTRIPVQKDRDSCPFVFAVISEVLRLRPVLEISLEHKSTCDCEINGFKIPKDTSMMFHFTSSHQNKDIWEDPEAFKPERFLESDGKFTTARKIGYMPFGLGRRSCPGEKLALVDIFLILVRVLQKLDIELEAGPGTADFTVTVEAFASMPKTHKTIVRRRLVSE